MGLARSVPAARQSELQPQFRITVDLDGDDYAPTATENVHAALASTLDRLGDDGLVRGYKIETMRG